MDALTYRMEQTSQKILAFLHYSIIELFQVSLKRLCYHNIKARNGKSINSKLYTIYHTKTPRHYAYDIKDYWVKNFR